MGFQGPKNTVTMATICRTKGAEGEGRKFPHFRGLGPGGAEMRYPGCWHQELQVKCTPRVHGWMQRGLILGPEQPLWFYDIWSRRI